VYHTDKINNTKSIKCAQNSSTEQELLRELKKTINDETYWKGIVINRRHIPVS
jgi:hypothetical protein